MHFYAKFFSYFSNYLLHIYKIWCILSHVDRTAEKFCFVVHEYLFTLVKL